MKTRKFTKEKIVKLKQNKIFVFGSNLNGNHAGGAAKLALDKFGAINGVAIGIQGNSYAIPTLNKKMEKITIDELTGYIKDFIYYSNQHSELEFLMTKIGCGIAGFTEQEVVNIFKKLNFPLNVSLPKEFCVTTGYKVFNSDWSCRNFKYEIGKDYSTDREIECCGHGFHFCEKLVYCYDYYDYDKKNKVAQIEVLGYTDTDDGLKFCTNNIKIVKEITWEQVDSLVNIGSMNTGKGNSGDLNSGDLNSGDQNSGGLNSGYRNSGDRNSGDRNSGDRNSGDLNSGDRNSGDRNSGGLNSGDLNSGYRNSGIFCNRKYESKVIIFNCESDMSWHEWDSHKVNRLTQGIQITEWIDWDSMSDEEKTNKPRAFVCGGYIKTYSYHEAWKNLWNTFSEEDKDEFKKLPNFDAEVFLDITGINLK